jgi:outer membrane lipoprotein-sorting protein
MTIGNLRHFGNYRGDLFGSCQMLHLPRMRRVQLTCFVVLFCLTRPGFAQPAVEEILRHVSEAYRAATQYEIDAVATTTNTARNGGPERLHFAFKTPNLYRLERTGPNGSTEQSESIIVYDGESLWIYDASEKEYESIPVSRLTAADSGDLAELRPEAMDHVMFWRYRNAMAFNHARLLRDETIPFDGRPSHCYVVEVAEKEGRLLYTWWVDKETYRILREDNSRSSSRFTIVRLGGELPVALFRFAPPAGARRRSQN